MCMRCVLERRQLAAPLANHERRLGRGVRAAREVPPLPHPHGRHVAREGGVLEVGLLRNGRPVDVRRVDDLSRAQPCRDVGGASVHGTHDDMCALCVWRYRHLAGGVRCAHGERRRSLQVLTPPRRQEGVLSHRRGRGARAARLGLQCTQCSGSSGALGTECTGSCALCVALVWALAHCPTPSTCSAHNAVASVVGALSTGVHWGLSIVRGSALYNEQQPRAAAVHHRG